MSKRFKLLIKEVERLRQHFLPKTFNQLGRYARPALVQANLRAFIVLSHAEVEGYLEGWAKEIVNAAESIWVKKLRCSQPLIYIVLSFNENLEIPTNADALVKEDINVRLSKIIEMAIEKSYKIIKNNHGIKESNLLSLFLPLGVPVAAVGAMLLPSLDSIGSLRGEHAHQPKRVLQTHDPETVYNNFTKLLTELQPFDTWLTKYRRQIK